MGDTAGPSQPTDSTQRVKRCAADFIFGKMLGEGSFSVVYLAKDVHTQKEWAVKVCEKRLIIRERKQAYVKRERDALNRMSGVPGFLKLFCTFQDPSKLYFVITYARNGTLLELMEKQKRLNLISVRFYAAQILLAMEEMHARHIIHRDLKPENILLDEEFHIMIADFGSSRIGDEQAPQQDDEPESEEQSERPRRGSFVGTAQYVSPEILRGRGSSEASDLWSFACILYQMIAGCPPFQGPNDYFIFQKINKLELTFPEGFNPEAEDLIRQLLVHTPRKRLGMTDETRYESIRRHKFFEGVDFSAIRTMKAPVMSKEAPTLDEASFPADMRPGLDTEQIAKLLGQNWFGMGPSGSGSDRS